MGKKRKNKRKRLSKRTRSSSSSGSSTESSLSSGHKDSADDTTSAKKDTFFIVQISDGNLLDFTTCLGTCTVQEGRVGNPDDVSGATAAALESRGRGREEKGLLWGRFRRKRSVLLSMSIVLLHIEFV
ncbi:uncharacterized protein LOC120637089 [Pararge aegeria]|uniref:uncharacterized protein LOC120628542 n=1 Tax=Pararge aegeria TaxID=116150 RepID=UPI0019CFF660|nr:uncharacterized protein LOC120628542 [Pararge aegeria]XP_039755653.1 uncharacterized protein LOC120630478 [Pararge aegeria]XP_039764658.1 uncharacterized protein LOC120637089 [Pararge aegeria]